LLPNLVKSDSSARQRNRVTPSWVRRWHLFGDTDRFAVVGQEGDILYFVCAVDAVEDLRARIESTGSEHH